MKLEAPLQGRKVLIHIHERIAPRDCGFHQRVWQVIDGLQTLGSEVHVIANHGPRPERSFWTDEARRVLAGRQVRLHLAPFHVGSPDFWLAGLSYLWVKKLRRQVMARPSSAYYWRPQLQALWQRVLREERVDAAIVNFAVWHRLVRSARRCGVWTAIEMIDLLADQFVASAQTEQGYRPSAVAVERFAADELNCLNTADCVLAINPAEGARLRPRLTVPVVDLPFCQPDCAPMTPVEPATDLLIIGSQIEHNKRGLRQFLEGAWPEIQAQAPGTRLQICGRVGEDIAADDNIRVTLNVPNLTPFYLGTKIALLTTVTGAGIKIKTIEALAHGCCIVAHEHSVKGVPFENGRHGEVLTNLRKAAPTILRLLARPEQRAAFQSQARQLFRENFDEARGREILARTFSAVRRAPKT